MPWWESGLLIVIFFAVMIAMAVWATMRHGPDKEHERALQREEQRPRAEMRRRERAHAPEEEGGPEVGR